MTNRERSNFVWAIFCSASMLFASALIADDATDYPISESGRGTLSIIVAEGASDATRHTTATLRDYLNRISCGGRRLYTDQDQ